MNAWWDLPLAIVAALVARFVSIRVTQFLRDRATAVELKKRTAGSSVNVSVPVVTNNWGLLEKSIGALSILSPAAAIVQGWIFVEAAIRNRGKSLGFIDADEWETMSLAKAIGTLTDDTMERLNKLNHLRNTLVHSEINERNPGEEVISAAKNILPLIREIGSPWITSDIRKNERNTK